MGIEERKEMAKYNYKWKECGTHCYCAWCDWLGNGDKDYCKKAQEKMKQHNRVEETKRNEW